LTHLSHQSFTKKRWAAWKAERLLDLEMSDGRALRAYTANECYAAGDWPRTLSRRVRDGWGRRGGRPLTVGDVYSESMLRLAFGAFYRQEIELADFHNERPVPGDEIDGDNFC
jgi:hypothetical protein